MPYKACKPVRRKNCMDVNFVLFFQLYESYEIKFCSKVSSFTVNRCCYSVRWASKNLYMHEIASIKMITGLGMYCSACTLTYKTNLNPLSAKQSFRSDHLWYPMASGQRLKVISFPWSWVKWPSKCFSNTESTTIIASRDEKWCNASVQWTRLVHSSSLPAARWPTPEMSRMTAFLRCPRSAAWPTCYCTATYTKRAKCKTVETSVSETGSSKLALVSSLVL